MRRFALLIGGDDLKASSHAQGVEKDLADFSQHLASNGGGAWEPDEMQLLLHPTRLVVLNWLALIEKSADYCAILYAGHGCHYTSPLHETALCLSDNNEILVRELNPRTPRHLVILDTCRKLTLVEERAVKAAAQNLSFSASRSSPSYRSSCRALFDRELQGSEEGRCIAYACDVNQTAGDNDQGGYFTQSMLGGARLFHGDSSQRYSATQTQTLRDSFGLAFIAVQRVNYPQRPILEEGRRFTSFPFAVK